MLTRNKVENFFQNNVFILVLLGLARKIWDNPVLDVISKVFGTFFALLMFFMLYLSWRETHSFREVFKQNWIIFVAFIFPVTILLLYVLYKACL